tara:strand:- start:309 stop:1700 length:1392 start_codon:yes stop_codon:yes gene_type:complete
MGADQSLIKAAAAMAPKQWDYSGIMKGIAALGKYAASKKQIADELTTYGDAEINIKEIPPEMMIGAFGDQNAEFFPGVKQLWSNATSVIKNPLNTPRGKKYKQAVKTINTLKSSLEKNKADLLSLADIKTQINNNWQNRSAGISRESFHRIADLQINNSTKELDGNMMFTIDNGIQIYANDVVNMQTRAYSVNEFMDGFYENIMNKDNNNSDLKKIIKSVGETRRNQDKDWKEDDARDMIRTFMTGLKNSKYGGNGIKSLAFDFDISAGGGTFVQANKNIFSNPELSGEDANTNYVEEYKKNNPEATIDEITLAYEHQASDVWNGSDSDVYESQIEDWLLGIAKKDYDRGQTKSDLNKSGKFQIGYLGGFVDNEKVFGNDGIVDRIKADKIFYIGRDTYKKVNGKWAINDVRGGGAQTKKNSGFYYINPDKQSGKYEDGSNISLAENLKVLNDKRFKFLTDKN